MNRISVIFPDGSRREYASGVALADIAKEAGRSDALVAKVDGTGRDLATRLGEDARIELLGVGQP